VDNKLVELLLSYLQINAQKLLKTSELSALVKKVSEEVENLSIIKDLLSIESSQISWPKVEISLPEMELEENQFMDPNSKMRISLSSILQEVICQWQMLVQTLTDLNFS